MIKFFPHISTLGIQWKTLSDFFFRFFVCVSDKMLLKWEIQKSLVTSVTEVEKLVMYQVLHSIFSCTSTTPTLPLTGMVSLSNYLSVTTTGL